MESIKKNFKQRLRALWDDPCALFSVLGFAFVSLTGTLLHFLPDLVENTFVYLIAPTNESVFEHLKLLFYPYVAFMAVEYLAYGKETRGFLGAKLRGVLLGMTFIVGAHYVFSGIIGRNVSAIDISLFFVGTALAYAVPFLMIKRGKSKEFSAVSSAAVFISIAALFSIFTFMPPNLGIFVDPQTGTVGI